MRRLRCGPLGVVLPAFYVALVTGVVPLRRDGDAAFRRSTPGLLWCLGHLVLTVFACVSVASNLRWRLSTGSCTVDNNCVASAVISAQLASELAGVAGALLRRRATLECLNLAGSVLGSAGPASVPLAAFAVVGFVACVAGRVVLLVYWMHNVKLSESVLWVVYLTPVAVEGLFGALCLAVQAGLASVNAGLEDLRTSLVEIPTSSEELEGTGPRHTVAEWMSTLSARLQRDRESRRQMATSLQRLRRQHSDVCDLACAVKARFGFDLLVAVPVSFLQVVLLLYFGVVSMSPSSPAFPTRYFVSTGTHFVITVARVCYACYRCEAVLSKSNRTHILLQKLNQPSLDSDSREEIRFFSMQLNFRRIDFTACGFFPIDFTLLYSIVGAVTTYLVILIQFQPPLKISDSNGVLNTTSTTVKSTT